MDHVEPLLPGTGDDEDVHVADVVDALSAVATQHLAEQAPLGPQRISRRGVLGVPRESVAPPPAPAAVPWTTVVTRMSSSRTSWASTLPNASSAAFEATYMDSIGNGCSVDSLDVLTMSPPPAARSNGTAARDV